MLEVKIVELEIRERNSWGHTGIYVNIFFECPHCEAIGDIQNLCEEILPWEIRQITTCEKCGKGLEVEAEIRATVDVYKLVRA